jgi:phosphate-selective porin OprO and OprP
MRVALEGRGLASIVDLVRPQGPDGGRRRGSQRIWWGATAILLSVLTVTGPALAQEPSPSPPPSREAIAARIEGLKAEMNRFADELGRLEAAEAALGAGPPAQAAAAAPQKPTPSSNENIPTTAARAGAGGTGLSFSISHEPTYGEGVPTSGAVAVIGGGRPSIQSADGRLTVNFLGVMQLDGANYFQAPPGPLDTDFRRSGDGDDSHARELGSGFNFRRARIGFGGRFVGFEYSTLFEFGGSGQEDAGHIQEVWLQYSGLRPLHLRAGAFAPFIGLEDAGSTSGMLFLERPAISDIARSVAAGGYREGVQLAAVGQRWFASGAVTARTVTVISPSGGPAELYGDPLGVVGRIAVLPVQSPDLLLHLGAHGSYLVTPGNAGGPDPSPGTISYPVELRTQPELRVDPTQFIDTGQINAAHAATVGAELAIQHRNLFLQGEYEWIKIDRRGVALANPWFWGWYIEGSWLLTGEIRRYNSGNFAFDGPAVTGGFDPGKGDWGALEFAARYSVADLNYRAGLPGTAPSADAIRGGKQDVWSVGLNWYLNQVVRLMFDFQHVNVGRLSPNAVTFNTPAGAQIGQSYDVVSMRVQLAD